MPLIQIEVSTLDEFQAAFERGELIGKNSAMKSPKSSSPYYQQYSFITRMFIPAYMNPPLVFLPFLIRLLVSACISYVRLVTKVPVMNEHEADNMGFLMNLILGQRPAIRGIHF